MALFNDVAILSTDQGPPSMVPISSLLPADSPRLAGENMVHVRLLAEIESALPPILVHRSTMRVIDGMHRLQAATLRGDEMIEARFVEGPEEHVFLLAVAANLQHGLPLSLTDREAAAQRVLASYPEWSDRAIAAATGLSAGTVSAIRCRATDQYVRSNVRIGLDGRARPIDITERRQRAYEFARANTNMSLRELAQVAGISIGTARDVRERARRGAGALPDRLRAAAGNGDGPYVPAARNGEDGLDKDPPPESWSTILQNLKRDPSLRFSESGKQLLRWLDNHLVDAAEPVMVAGKIPAHCAGAVMRLARGCAENWLALAEELEKRESAE